MADIKEVKKLKIQCEDKIRSAIYGFEDQSELTVKGIMLSRDENGSVIVKLKVDLE